jgi:hypothetical protein
MIRIRLQMAVSFPSTLYVIQLSCDPQAFRDHLQHMQPLSEKAKGKQRADPIPEDAINHGGPIPPRQLMVRFTEGVEDLVLHVAEHDSVRDVKAEVCSYLPLSISPAAHIPYLFMYVSDPRSAPKTPAPSPAPHPRWPAPGRRHAPRILAWHARRAPAAAAHRDKSQRRHRSDHIPQRAAQLRSSPGARAMAALFRRRPTIRRRGRRRGSAPGTPLCKCSFSFFLSTQYLTFVDDDDTPRSLHFGSAPNNRHSRRRKSGPCAALTASRRQGSPRTTF